MKPVEDGVAVDASEVAELRILDADVEMRCLRKVGVVGERVVLAIQEEGGQIRFCGRRFRAGSKRRQGHQLAGVRLPWVWAILGKSRIGQAKYLRIAIAGLVEHVTNESDVQVFVDCVEGAQLPFPDERVTRRSRGQRRHPEGAQDV